MFQIAGGIILAVVVLFILGVLIQWMAMPRKKMTKSEVIELAIKTEKRDVLVQAGKLKHLEWEKKHPIAKYFYNFDSDKYISKKSGS